MKSISPRTEQGSLATRLRRLARSGLALALIAITWLALDDVSELPEVLQIWDKANHLLGVLHAGVTDLREHASVVRYARIYGIAGLRAVA